MQEEHDVPMLKDHGEWTARVSQAWKQPSLQIFLNQNKNKGMPNPKSRSWNKINKNTTCAKQKSNKILL